MLRKLFILLLLFPIVSVASESTMVIEAELNRIEHYTSSNRSVLFYRSCPSCRTKENTISPTARIRINNTMQPLSFLIENKEKIQGIITFTLSKKTNQIILIGASMRKE